MYRTSKATLPSDFVYVRMWRRRACGSIRTNTVLQLLLLLLLLFLALMLPLGAGNSEQPPPASASERQVKIFDFSIWQRQTTTGWGHTLDYPEDTNNNGTHPKDTAAES